MLEKIKIFGSNAILKLGIFNTFSVVWHKLLNILPTLNNSYQIGKLKLKHLQHPLFFRYNSSDLSVFSQIFVYGEYEPLIEMQNVQFILDCGANVGYSAIYFLSKFPNAHIIAVEPDQQNYELLKQNLAPYSNRVTTLCAAIWSHPSQLKLHYVGQVGDKCEWAVEVKECEEPEKADIEAQDIGSILSGHKWDRVDILKIDIEGSETVVFGSNYESWIDKIQAFAIELHGIECEAAFLKALSYSDFNFSRSGELTIAQRHEKVVG
jgi:FkbM family methyltransferase